MITNILSVLLMVLVNGLFAMSEMAVVSAREARLQQRARDGDVKAQTALKLTHAPNRFLSTVQIGITLVGILAGAFGGATLSEDLARIFDGIPWLAPYSEALSFGVVVVLTTYLTLILGELVPKRLALNNPEQIAMFVAKPMDLLATIAYPVVRFLSFSTRMVVRLMGIRPSTEPPVTEDELRLLLHQGTKAGIFEEAEQDMVENIFRLNDLRVGALMTPRTEIIWLDLNDAPEQIRKKIVRSPYSRFPVCDGGLDNLLGVVMAKDLLISDMKEGAIDLKGNLTTPLFVPETMLSSRIVELFKTAKTQIALVIDEYGGTQGVVTLQDVLEAIVGDIIPPEEEPQIVQRDDGSWLLDGLLRIDEFKEHFDLKRLPDETRGEYQTLAGFVLEQFDRIPKEGQSFTWNDLRFEVIDMDGFRIDKVLVRHEAPEDTEAEDQKGAC